MRLRLPVIRARPCWSRSSSCRVRAPAGTQGHRVERISALVELTAVVDGDPRPSKPRRGMRRWSQLIAQWTESETKAYVDSLRECGDQRSQKTASAAGQGGIALPAVYRNVCRLSGPRNSRGPASVRLAGIALGQSFSRSPCSRGCSPRPRTVSLAGDAGSQIRAEEGGRVPTSSIFTLRRSGAVRST